MRKDDGRTDHFTCLNSSCTEIVGTIRGSKSLPDGSYQIIQTDDPKISIVRDPEGTTTIGYLVDSGPTDSKFFKTLDEAQSYEHRGDSLKLAGKIALGTLVVGALVVGAAAAAAADSRANTVTTTCSSIGNSTTCTSR